MYLIKWVSGRKFKTVLNKYNKDIDIPDFYWNPETRKFEVVEVDISINEGQYSLCLSQNPVDVPEDFIFFLIKEFHMATSKIYSITEYYSKKHVVNLFSPFKPSYKVWTFTLPRSYFDR